MRVCWRGEVDFHNGTHMQCSILKTHFRFIALTLLLCASWCVPAQNIPFVPPIYNYQTGTYKGGSQNWAIAQGCDGVIYIGNNNGLLTFDGTNWILHKLPNGLSVKSILIDTMQTPQRIYVGSFEEFGYFEPDYTNQLTYHSLKPLLKKYTFQNDEIWTIHKQKEKIYFQSFSSYFIFNEAKFEVQHTKPFPAPLYFFEAKGNIFSQFIDEDFYQLKNEKFERLFYKKLIQNDYIVSVLPLGNSYLLVSSENGIFEFNPLTQEIFPWKTEIDAELKAAIANRVIMTKDSAIIIGTLNNGIFAIHKNKTKKWHLNRQNGLNNNTILGLFNDKEENIWAALDNGIAYIQSKAGLSFYEPVDIQLGLVEDILLHKEALYVATNQGIYKYSTAKGKMHLLSNFDTQSWFIRRFGEQIITGNNRGTSFIEDDQNIPVGTATGGMDIKQVTFYNQDILIESTYTYLSVYRKNTIGKWRYSHQIDGFYDLINQLEIDHTGNIWAGHMYKGVYKLRLNEALNAVTEKIYYSHLNPKDTTSVPIRVMKLKGRIIFSDGKAFYTYDDIKRSIIPYEQLNTDLHGFEDTNKIIPVNDSIFWFVRDNEYLLITYSDNTYRVWEKIPFSILNNPPNTERGNVYVAENGTSFLCLNGGIAQFMPENFRRQSIDRLRLHSVSSYNRENDKHLYLNVKNISEAIRYANNNLTFEFQYTDFSRKGFKVECYLEEYDSRWITVPNDLKINYTNLPAAEYTLKARVINEFGDELSTLSYSFRIKNPWHKTIWAITLYILLILFSAYLLVRKYTKHVIRKKNEVFMQQEKDRLAQIEKQEKLITTLENERLETDLVHKSKELASATMNIINQKEFLYKLRSEIQSHILSGKINKTEGNKLLSLIVENLSEEDDWAVFKENFDLIHENFFRKLQEKYPALTPTDLKLCALLRLNYASKEIANMLNLTIRGVEAARYRLRKKLNLSEEDNLVSFMIDFK